MLRYTLRRLLVLIPTLLGVSFIVFGLLYLTPGDAVTASMGANAPQSAIDAQREALGLNDPFLVQYGRFLTGVLHGDLGQSYYTHKDVTDTLMAVFPNTVKLSLLALGVACFFGLGFGILSAVKRDSIFDQVSMILGLIGLAMPIFWSGLLLILFFSVRLKWFPSSGFNSFSAMVLPALALGFQSTAVIMRQTRAALLVELSKDYIRTARAKGLSEGRILAVHALKNTLITVLTVIGLQMGTLLGGSVLTETIFSIPGLGRIMVDSVKTRDYPIILGGVMLIATTYTLISIAVDLLYGVVNPRVRPR